MNALSKAKPNPNVFVQSIVCFDLPRRIVHGTSEGEEVEREANQVVEAISYEGILCIQ